MRFLVLALFVSLSFASLQGVVDAFLKAQMDESWNSYVEATDLSDLNATALEEHKAYVEAFWERLDLLSYEISDFKEVINGSYALAAFNVSSRVRVESTGKEYSYERPYVALLHRSDGWKVVYMMPLATYLEMTEEYAVVSQLNKASQILQPEPLSDEQLLIDGKPPQLIYAEKSEEAAEQTGQGEQTIRCLSDLECPPGKECLDGVCQRRIEEPCFFPLLIVGFAAGSLALARKR